MSRKTENNTDSAHYYALKIFEAKDRFHKDQAKLPIEEKVKILVELQKIVLETQPDTHSGEFRQVWKLM